MTRARWIGLIWRSVRDWRDGLRTLTALVRGTYYALFFRLFRRDVVIDLPFLAHEAVSITGPGSVRIGGFCSVYPNVFRGLSIVTLSPSAAVRIGPRCSLGGLVIRCFERVAIGEKTMTAHSLIQDVLFFSSPEGHVGGGDLLIAGPVEVGRNVWLGGFSCLLSKSSVGDDSVLSWGATCLDTAVPPASVATGNPVMRTVPIDRLQQFGGSAGDLNAARLPL